MCTDSRRRFFMQSALLLGAAGASRLAFAQDGGQAPPVGGQTYVCPPCGCAADGQEFSQPGKCPACGMTLIEKSSVGRPNQLRVAIMVFEGVQIIDFAAPFEVFGEAGYDVFTVGATASPLATNMGLMITPRYSFANAPAADVLLVPGGNIGQAMQDQATIDWVRTRSGQVKQTISVCNGAFFLAKGRLLEGLTATTFHRAIDRLRSEFPNITVVSDRRYVDNGRVVTSAGLSSGIDGALHVVSKLSGLSAAQLVALNMEYDWHQDDTYARADFADRHLWPIFGTNHQLNVPAGQARLQSTAGDSKTWETTWGISDGGSAATVTKSISDLVAAKSTWTLGRGSDTRRNWTFTDEKRRKWRAALDTTSSGVAGMLRATLKLQVSG